MKPTIETKTSYFCPRCKIPLNRPMRRPLLVGKYRRGYCAACSLEVSREVLEAGIPGIEEVE